MDLCAHPILLEQLQKELKRRSLQLLDLEVALLAVKAHREVALNEVKQEAPVVVIQHQEEEPEVVVPETVEEAALVEVVSPEAAKPHKNE